MQKMTFDQTFYDKSPGEIWDARHKPVYNKDSLQYARN